LRVIDETYLAHYTFLYDSALYKFTLYFLTYLLVRISYRCSDIHAFCLKMAFPTTLVWRP